jgi:hypothetical protein
MTVDNFIPFTGEGLKKPDLLDWARAAREAGNYNVVEYAASRLVSEIFLKPHRPRPYHLIKPLFVMAKWLGESPAHQSEAAALYLSIADATPYNYPFACFVRGQIHTLTPMASREVKSVQEACGRVEESQRVAPHVPEDPRLPGILKALRFSPK